MVDKLIEGMWAWAWIGMLISGFWPTPKTDAGCWVLVILCGPLVWVLLILTWIFEQIGKLIK